MGATVAYFEDHMNHKNVGHILYLTSQCGMWTINHFKGHLVLEVVLRLVADGFQASRSAPDG